jgi:SAM-dependent methyltransferase
MTIAPPTVEAMFDGPQSVEAFMSDGAEFLGVCVDVCGLARNARVLDVGSGIGRKTIPLTTYLGPEARYEGLDPVQAGVDWCTENITAKYPNFRFQHVDVRTPGYNPAGSIKPSEFRFPFDDGLFDFVMFGSVFTHMMRDDVRHYLNEAKRVLTPGGRCLSTWYLLEIGEGHADFPYVMEGGMCAWASMPEQSAAFYRHEALGAHLEVGLRPLRMGYGRWSGNAGGALWQDFVAAKKP